MLSSMERVEIAESTNMLKRFYGWMVKPLMSGGGDTPLHTACKYGNLESVKEIIKTNPSYVDRLNDDGLSPFHLAAENGHDEIVREFMNFNTTLSLVKDREGRNPLYYAVMAGEIDVVREILFDILFSKRFLSYIHPYQVVNSKDREGNTILHMATFKGHLDIVELLMKEDPYITKWVQVNAVNTAGFTPLDIASNRFDLEIKEMLQEAGGLRGKEIIKSNNYYKKWFDESSLVLPPKSEERWKVQSELIAMLSIAVLIAGNTFQAGLNPPRVVTKEEYENKTYQHLMLFRLFMFFNSAGFFASLAVLILTSFQLILGQALLLFSVISMVGSYVCSVITLAQSAGFDAFIIAVPLLMFVAIQYVLLLKKNVAGKKNEKEMSG